MDEAGLLAEVLAHPEDDGVRLVYADWFEDHGQLSRASFIRHQIEAHQLPPGSYLRLQLEEAAEELMRKDARTWDPPLRSYYRLQLERWVERHQASSSTRDPGLPGQRLDYLSYEYERGFAGILETNSVDYWLREWPRIQTLAPIQRLVVVVEEGELPLLAESPALATIKHLRVSIGGRQQIGPEGLLLLFGSPHLRHLTGLTFSHPVLAECSEPIEPLAGSGLLSHIVDLDLSRCAIDDRGLRVLAESSQLGSLRSLNLHVNRVTNQGILSLSRASDLRHLTHLDLSGNEIGGEGIAALAASGVLANLFYLDLSGNLMGDSSVCDLLKSPLNSLVYLNLGENDIGNAGARALAEVGSLCQLDTLDLHRNRIGKQGGRALAESSRLPKLRSLELGGNRLGNEAAFAFAGCPQRQYLRNLNLVHTRITERGARALAESPYLSEDLSLGLSTDHIGDDIWNLLCQRFGNRVWGPG